MDTTLQRTGTSLEVLAPYLPYGIEVEWKGWETGKSYRATMIALNTRYNSIGTTASNQYASPENLLPVLRPFSALCTPLEGGEVPAVSVMNSPPPLRGRITCAKYVEHETMGPVVLGYINPNHQYEEAIFLSAFLNGHLIQAQVEVLRRLHFAVGLSDTDFIAK